MHPHLMGELARLHAEDLRREAAAARLARSFDRVDRPLRDRARLAAGASVVGALLLLAVR